jgi:hypothetical protein
VTLVSALETCGMRRESSVGNAASYGLDETIYFRSHEISEDTSSSYSVITGGGGVIVRQVAGARISTVYNAEYLLSFPL